MYTYHNTDAEYKKFDRKAAAIVTALRNKVAKSGYYENLGATEERKFADDLAKSGLTYPEKYQLKEMLRVSIEGI